MKTLVSAPADHSPLRSPLPDPVRSPLWLLIAAILPQSILVVLNLQDYGLMAGEMDPAQVRWAAGLFAGQLALLGGTLTGMARWHARRQSIPWSGSLALFLPHAAWLAVATWAIGDSRVVPASVSAWIVPPGQLLYHQWVFLSPALFLSLVGLANFPSGTSRAWDLGRSTLTATIIPVFWYLGMVTLEGFRLPGLVIVAILVGLGLVCLGAFLRALTIVYTWADRGTAASRAGLALVCGLIGPLAGLALNARIAFPADFQSAAIYALAVANGLVLMLPVTNHAALDRLVWFARCALFPFTAYFFFVFLPFLPLAIPAMAFFGAGFLILAPTALMIVHSRLVIEPLLLDFRDGWGFRSVLLALAAATLLPAGIVIPAWRDRAALREGIAYIFQPDRSSAAPFSGNRPALRRALEGLRDQKTSAYRPFLSEFYEASVFNGMTLSDAKMQTLHRAFFGAELPMPPSDGMLAFRNRRRMNPSLDSRETAPFPRDVRLVETTTSSRQEDGCTVTTVNLALRNASTLQSEYVTTIHVPPGTLVSGYWLDVGTERVPGRIFEKSSAFWVYRMIRDVTRRDPGIVTYTSPTTLELRVFPFAGNETRTTALEFLTPPGWNGTLRIGERSIPVTSAAEGLAWIADTTRSRLLVPADAAHSLPVTQRLPYLHFVVDRSGSSSLDPAQAVRAMRAVLADFPGVRWIRVTTANFNLSELTPSLWPVDRIDALAERPESEWLPREGGFLRDRAIQHALLRFHESWSASLPAEPLFWHVPAIVVLAGSKAEPLTEGNLGAFAHLCPDMDAFWTRTPDGALRAVAWDGNPARRPGQSPAPLVVFRAGNRLGACRADRGPSTVDFQTLDGSEGVRVFDPATRSFGSVTYLLTVPRSSRYARGVGALLDEAAHRETSSRSGLKLRDVVQASRDAAVLTPSTSYIVVENSAQWEALRRAESRLLKSGEALDFMESPEPSTALVVAAASVWLLRRRPRVSTFH